MAQFDLDGVVDMFGPIAMDCYSDQQLLSIFPNPVIDKLNVTLQLYTTASGKVKAEVNDVQGKNYYTGYIPLDGNVVQHSIDCSRLDPGTYLLVVYAEDGTKETRNFIVK